MIITPYSRNSDQDKSYRYKNFKLSPVIYTYLHVHTPTYFKSVPIELIYFGVGLFFFISFQSTLTFLIFFFSYVCMHVQIKTTDLIFFRLKIWSGNTYIFYKNIYCRLRWNKFCYLPYLTLRKTDMKLFDNKNNK